MYAFLLAILLRVLHTSLLTPVASAIDLIGQGSIPVMLLLLGIQLSQTRLGKRYPQVAIGVFLRLVVGAAIAFALAPLMGLTGLARSVGIAEASTPLPSPRR
ncbi:MAG: hypothetical protein GXY52_08375 [Chloroflexi bacterium]|nr:hypothetical protein [Chloroflexota bacterium]